MRAEYSGEDGKLLITVGEELTSKYREEMLEILNEYEHITCCSIDFTRTRYVDSTGAGLLIIFRQQMGGAKSRIELINCNPTVMDAFQLSGLKTLFSIKGDLSEAC